MIRSLGVRRRASWAVLAGMLFATAERTNAGELRGTVVDRKGEPAGGAAVWAARYQGGAAPREVHETTANDEGRFLLTVGIGRFFVCARRGNEGGKIASRAVIEVRDGRDPSPVVIRLREPSKLQGRLLDAENGRPIAGARFIVDDARIIAADEQGRFDVPGLVTGHHSAQAASIGYEPKEVLFDTTFRPDARLELRLRKAGKVVGRVTNGDGKPIVGARVLSNAGGNAITTAALWVQCDENGRFACDQGFGLRRTISARAPGFAEQQRDGVLVIEDDAPPELHFTLVRDAPGRTLVTEKPETGRRNVLGTVVSQDGTAIANALVRWGVEPIPNAPEARTDEQGRFQLLRLPDEPGMLVVSGRMLSPAFAEIPSGDVRDLKVVLGKGITIRGRVRDESGAPIVGVEVIPHAPVSPRLRSELPVGELSAYTDEAGRFLVQGIPPGAVSFTMTGDGLTSLRRKTLESGEGALNEVTMAVEGAIRGRVVGPDGHAVRNFRVLLNVPTARQGVEKAGGFSMSYSGLGVTFTADDGTFIVSGLVAGNMHRVSVVAQGYSAGEVDLVTAQPITRLPEPERLTIKLGLPHALRVRVFTAGGRVVKGARVTLVNGDTGPVGSVYRWNDSRTRHDDRLDGRVNAEGWAEFPSLPFGHAKVLVQARGFGRRYVPWRDDEPERLVDLEPEAVISGAIRDERGEVPDSAYVVILSSSGDQIVTGLDAKDGHFVLSELPPDRYQLIVYDPAGELHQEQVTLSSGQKLVLEIRTRKDVAVPKKAIR
jgi:hypothetical protein